MMLKKYDMLLLTVCIFMPGYFHQKINELISKKVIKSEHCPLKDDSIRNACGLLLMCNSVYITYLMTFGCK